MRIYIARHGQTDWNVEHKAQGRTDIPLNDTGKKQAEQLRENIKDIKFDAVYASPLQRAAETAQIAIDGRNEIIYDDRLMERSFGDYEGRIFQDWDELTEELGVSIFDDTIDELPHGIETVRAMRVRARDFLEDLQQKNSNDSQILIVVHAGIGKALSFGIADLKGEDWQDFHVDHAEAREYEV